MKNTLLLSGVLAGAACGPLHASQPERPFPNVVFIIADDLGYGDLSCYGQEKFSTPNIDRLALEGLRFTQCYAGTTVSAPSRACLMTGLHSGHAPIRGNLEVEPEGQMSLPDRINTLFRVFKKAGFTTGCFGKWGLGAPGTGGDPNRQGVDEFFGYNCQLLAHNYYADHLWHNGDRVELHGNDGGAFGTYTQDLIQQHGLDFISDNRERPFFLFLPYVIPHAELIVPEDSIIRKYRGRYPERPHKGCDAGPSFRKGGYCSQKEPRATFAAMVSRLDTYVGQVVARLKETGLYDNTLIIFCSDNGPHMEGGADPVFFNSNGIYRGFKRDLYEGGIRVPFILSWPGRVAAGETDFICAFWDMLPTFAEICGVRLEEEVDGISLLPMLEGRDGQREHEHLYFEFHEGGGRQAVRKGDWKLVRLRVSGDPEKQRTELYNLAADPSECHDLSALYPQKVRELEEIVRREHRPDRNWPLLEEEYRKCGRK